MVICPVTQGQERAKGGGSKRAQGTEGSGKGEQGVARGARGGSTLSKSCRTTPMKR